MLKIRFRTLTKEEKKLIRSAFDLAGCPQRATRKSGEAYIFHPIAVAKLVASEMVLDATSIAAAIFTRVVENNYSLEDIDRMFGTPLILIVDGLQKLPHQLSEDVSMQAENSEKCCFAE